ncbi:MAG: hypothetical protein K9M08_23505 [Pirellula sp.]|nr:hypothetical protein [Pirellula sp.]
MIQKQVTDTIIDEIHRTRREMADKFGGDFRLMLEDARRRQAESGRPIWRPNSTNNPMHPIGGSPSSGMDASTPAAG